MEVIFSLLVSAGIAYVFGKITQGIIVRKGYDENWFWWGFFLGTLAIIVALIRPRNSWKQSARPLRVQPTYDDNRRNIDAEIRKYQELLDAGIINEDDFNMKKSELLGK